MQTSYLYHATLALISREVLLRSHMEIDQPVIDSISYLQTYLPLAEFVAVYGSKGAIEKFPSSLSKSGNRIILTKPNVEFWRAKGFDEFTRGDICFFLDNPPFFDGFLRSYECRVIWNLGIVVNPALEKWVRNNAEGTGTSAVVQHTNGIAGSDYFIMKAELRGILEFFKFLKDGMSFPEWTEKLDPIESALEDARLNWGSKWFMSEKIMSRSLELVHFL